MKRIICLSILLFANIILLVHVAVPHHGHGNLEICFSDHHEHSDSQTQEHESSAFPHHCCIDHFYQPAHNSVKITCRSHTNCDCGQTLYALIPNALYRADFVDKTQIHCRQNPYVPLFYSDFVSRSIGLRAPPF